MKEATSSNIITVTRTIKKYPYLLYSRAFRTWQQSVQTIMCAHSVTFLNWFFVFSMAYANQFLIVHICQMNESTLLLPRELFKISIIVFSSTLNMTAISSDNYYVRNLGSSCYPFILGIIGVSQLKIIISQHCKLHTWPCAWRSRDLKYNFSFLWFKWSNDIGFVFHFFEISQLK